MFVCGKTRSGKSYLIERLLRGVKTQKLIIDIKGTFEHDGTILCTTPNEVYRAIHKDEDVLFRPDIGDYDAIDDAFDIAYRRRNITIYNDERGGWPGKLCIQMLPMEAWAVMRGGQLNVAVWTGTQRPSRIPVHLMSEADHFFTFQLQNPVDRKKVAEYAGDGIAKAIIPKRWFWYSGPNSTEVLYPPLKEVK